MSTTTEHADVVIIGGGPAGSTVASYLAMNGHDVTLFEKAIFPRDHVGESLLPFCYEVFDDVGVLPQLKKRFVRKPGVRFIDIDGSSHTTWCFGHVIKDESYLSFHVIRAEFDQMLLECSRKNGAMVHEGMRVRDVDLHAPDGMVHVTVESAEGEQRTVCAKHLVDTSGRDTFLANRNGWKKPHPKLDRTALSTHWLDGKFVEGIEEGLLQIVYLGGEKQGWIWVIPVGPDRLSIGTVLNHEYIRKRKAELTAAGEEDWQTAFYKSELMTSPFVKDILAEAHIAQPLMVNGNYSYEVDHKYGQNYCMVGDAGAFIDPIFASGVYLALHSSKLVSEAIHKNLTMDDGVNHLDAAYEEINGAYKLVDRAIGMFYNPGALNFAQVGSVSGVIHKQHETALAIGHYLLAGDFFRNHRKYYEFLDLLEDPNLLKKYKEHVIDRKEFQANTCGLERMEIFHNLLEMGNLETEMSSAK